MKLVDTKNALGFSKANTNCSVLSFNECLLDAWTYSIQIQEYLVQCFILSPQMEQTPHYNLHATKLIIMVIYSILLGFLRIILYIAFATKFPISYSNKNKLHQERFFYLNNMLKITPH